VMVKPHRKFSRINTISFRTNCYIMDVS